jgi:hypothetical protein
MGDLLNAFNASAKAAASATDEGGLDEKRDAALVEAGRTIAARVDEAIELGEGQEVTKALYLVPHLMNVLREMYATPKARHDAGLTAKGGASGGSKLAQLQSLKGGKSA